MSPEMLHSAIMVLVIGVSFLFPKTVFAEYDMQISALLFLMFFIVRKFFGDRLRSRLLEAVVFAFVILMTINSTGGVSSPFFFLLYFLLFSVSLLLEPAIAITSTLALIVFFILALPPNQSWQTMLPIFSLAFLTPFALFMGQEYAEIQREKKKTLQLKEALANSEEQTDLFLSLMVKNHLKSIRYHLDNFMGDHDLHSLKKHVRNLENQIEKFEDGQETKNV
jgi:hypothetical protein